MSKVSSHEIKLSFLLMHDKFLGKMSKLFVHRMRLVYIGSAEFISDLNISL